MKKLKSMLVSNDRGFTLIEILIAITLLAFVTMGLVSITQNAANTMERTTTINKNNLQIETALARFEWDFSQIYSPLYFSTLLNLSSADPYAENNIPQNDANNDGVDDFTGLPIAAKAAPLSPELQAYYQRLISRFEQNQHFSGVSKEGLPVPRFYSPEKTIFEFFTSSNRRKIENTKQSHFAWVRYALGEALVRDDSENEKNPNIPQGLKSLVRYFAPDDPYDDKRIDPEDAKIKGSVLLENVESFEFKFWNMNSRKWEDSLRAIEGGESALRGIKILITWYDSSGIKRSVERIYRNHWPMEVPQDTPAQAPASEDTGLVREEQKKEMREENR